MGTTCPWMMSGSKLGPEASRALDPGTGKQMRQDWRDRTQTKLQQSAPLQSEKFALRPNMPWGWLLKQEVGSRLD